MALPLLQRSKKNHHQHHHNQQHGKGSARILVTVTVLGSAGPLRFLINEEELVASVIGTTLRLYAREGRLPVLGSDHNNFLLYSANAGSDALSPWEPIGAYGSRNFLLCRKQQQEMTTPAGQGSPSVAVLMGRKGSGSWKSWLNKSLNLKISSH